MRDLKTLGFHHITMVSRDARRTLDFYGGLLGLPLVKKTVNFDDPSAYHLYFGDGRGGPGTILTFFEWANTPKGRWGVGGVHHLALGTADATTQLKWKRRLTDHGVPVSGPYDRGYFKSIYFADPDGQILEIATRGPGYGFDEPMDALGQRRMQPAAGRLPAGRDESAIAALIHPEPVSDVTPDMRLEGIHHITAITDDLDRAHDFYTQALGLELVKKTVNQDDGTTGRPCTTSGRPTTARRWRPTARSPCSAGRAPTTWPAAVSARRITSPSGPTTRNSSSRGGTICWDWDWT
jgi:glyoxalase family protein